jgi:hypothetical protein
VIIGLSPVSSIYELQRMFDPDVCSRTGDNLLLYEVKLIYLDNVAEQIVRRELPLVCRPGSKKMVH